MKLVLRIQLLPDADQTAQLRTTMERFNEAANWIAGELFSHQVTNKREAQKLLYREVRNRFSLSAQTAILCIHRVCEAYKRDKTIRPEFRKHAAMIYDVRTMRFKSVDRVSLLTLDGRIVVPFIMGGYQAERFVYPKGQCDLVLRKDGKWFLMVTVDIPDGTPVPATDVIGVDLGIINIATDSDGNTHTGEAVEKVRRKHKLQRKRLQKKGTKGAKKKLKRVGDKESRFRRHENHCISKRIVESARRTGRGIALEDLSGIHDRVTARGGDGRHRLRGWAFSQLRTFIDYKARLIGIPVILVDPRGTSQTCSVCGHGERANRKSQSKFSCRSCGHHANADMNAARNIRARAILSWPYELATVDAGPWNPVEVSRKSHVLQPWEA